MSRGMTVNPAVERLFAQQELLRRADSASRYPQKIAESSGAEAVSIVEVAEIWDDVRNAMGDEMDV